MDTAARVRFILLLSLALSALNFFFDMVIFRRGLSTSLLKAAFLLGISCACNFGLLFIRRSRRRTKRLSKAGPSSQEQGAASGEGTAKLDY